MKLAVSGSAGVGKTTLAKELAKRLDVACIDEHYDRFFDEEGRFIEPPAKLRQLVTDVLEYKHEIESKSGGFVSDRCPVDLFNLWLSRGFAKYRDETLHLYQRCRAYLDQYDAVIVLPWGHIPLRQLDVAAEKRRRVMNPWIQLHNHSTIAGLIIQWVHPSRILPVPSRIKDHKSRVEYLVGKINRLNDINPAT